MLQLKSVKMNLLLNKPCLCKCDIFTHLTLAVNCCIHHHLQSTCSLLLCDHVTMPVSITGWVPLILVFGTSSWYTFLETGPHMTTGQLIIRPCIHVCLCCCLATKTWKLLECHMHSLKHFN